MSTGERHGSLGDRIAYGRPRKPLEPHRPAPWLVRGIAWLLASAGFAVLATVPAVIVVEGEGEGEAAGAVAAAGGGLLVVAMLGFWISGALRPTPVVLDPVGEE